tara:strand:+ start:7537 stop:8508 length:972 start_codon:yes stop_codon:yes gene_type:complete
MTVGQYLRSQREGRGEDISQVADVLRIHNSYLKAIEESDIEKLPGSTYAMGFVRAYANYLGLDSAEVVERFKDEAKVQASRTLLVPPSPLPGGRTPSRGILLVAVVLLAAAYGGWIYTSYLNEDPSEIVEAPPERSASFVGGETSKIEQPLVSSGTESAIKKGPETSSSTIEQSSDNAPKFEQVLNPKPVAAIPTKAAEATSTANTVAGVASLSKENLAEAQPTERFETERVIDSRVVILASEDSWVEVRDGNGELLLTRVLRQGESYHVPNRPGLTLVTGNAGGLKFSVDGDDVNDIGPPGTVRRNVLLDPQALKDGTAHSR